MSGIINNNDLFKTFFNYPSVSLILIGSAASSEYLIPCTKRCAAPVPLQPVTVASLMQLPEHPPTQHIGKYLTSRTLGTQVDGFRHETKVPLVCPQCVVRELVSNSVVVDTTTSCAGHRALDHGAPLHSQGGASPPPRIYVWESAWTMSRISRPSQGTCIYQRLQHRLITHSDCNRLSAKGELEERPLYLHCAKPPFPGQPSSWSPRCAGACPYDCNGQLVCRAD